MLIEGVLKTLKGLWRDSLTSDKGSTIYHDYTNSVDVNVFLTKYLCFVNGEQGIIITVLAHSRQF